jgi:hypothetical protein
VAAAESVTLRRLTAFDMLSAAVVCWRLQVLGFLRLEQIPTCTSRGERVQPKARSHSDAARRHLDLDVLEPRYCDCSFSYPPALFPRPLSFLHSRTGRGVLVEPRHAGTGRVARFEAAFVEERRKGLEAWLNGTANHTFARFDGELHKFLQDPTAKVRRFCPTLRRTMAYVY